jgi:hypothetical protein
MNRNGPRFSNPRSRADRMKDRPFASRLLLLVGLFLVLVPIAGIIRGSDGHVVNAGVLPGAVVGADPIVGSTSTTVAGVFPGLATTSIAPATTAPSSASSAPAGGSALSAQSDSGSTATTAATSTATTKAATKAPATTTKSTSATTAAPVKKAPSTTAAPKVTTTPAPKATTPPTTKAPATTTTTAAALAPPPNAYSKDDVEAIIRSVFPADQADQAVRIATRESNLVPTVRNWCCFGLFQIYFQMNQKTLAAIGVTSAEQLYDPRVNAEAAYAIWQRSGWAPWQ